MRLGFLFFVGFCAACSLNPQPFPPDNADGAADASLLGAPEAGGGEDSGSFGDDGGNGPDATIDAGGVDADAGLDASDADDASEDAPEDAPLDTRDDG